MGLCITLGCKRGNVFMKNLRKVKWQNSCAPEEMMTYQLTPDILGSL